MGSNQTTGHDPDEITMEEFYRLLHISKRRAAWILQAGLVPCEDRGSRTWRYRIPRQEALSFQKKFQAYPERYSPPPGSFSSTAGKQNRPVLCVRREELTAALTVRWSAFRSCWTVPGFRPVRDMPVPLSAAGCVPESFPPAGSGEGLRSPSVT